MKAVDEMSLEELEAAMKKKKDAKKKEQEEAKRKYEGEKKTLATSLVTEALGLQTLIESLHTEAKTRMLEFQKKAREYGGLRGNSRGGFSIEADKYKVVLRFHAIWDFDERIGMAEELLRDFMGSTIKKRDLVLHDLLMTLLQKNAAGKLEPKRVMDILVHEEKFEDERWKRACTLIKESYQERASKYYMEFQVKDSDGKWNPVNLNFSSY